MISRVLACFLVLLPALPQMAGACRYEPLSLDAALEKSGTAFIGTAKSIENGTVAWMVEKGIKGLNDGAAFSSRIGGESCDIRFQQGERWLFLGETQLSGSLLLQDANGTRLEGNIKAVNDKFSGAAEPATKTQALTGTLEPDCAPWDGQAYTIRLSNGLVASVYVPISNLEHKGRNTSDLFPADGKSERNHGQILRCPEGKPDAPCQFLQGSITMGHVDSFTAHGHLDIAEGDQATRHAFQVKRVQKQVFCP